MLLLVKYPFINLLYISGLATPQRFLPSKCYLSLKQLCESCWKCTFLMLLTVTVGLVHFPTTGTCIDNLPTEHAYDTIDIAQFMLRVHALPSIHRPLKTH